MKVFPTVNVYIDESKEKKDGTFPLNIIVTYRGTRAKESLKISLSKPDYKRGLWKRLARSRLTEIENRIEELLSVGAPFTAKDCLAATDNTTNPTKVLSELAAVKRLGDGTVRTYNNAIVSLKKYFGEDFLLSDITLHQMQGFARYTKVAPGTMCNYLKKIKSLLQFATERGYLKENIMSGWNFRAEGYKFIDKPRSKNRGDISVLIKHFENGNKAAGIWLSGYFFCGLGLADLMFVDWPKVQKTFIDGGWFFQTTVNRKKTREVANIVTPVFPLTEKLYEFLCTKPWEGYSVFQYTGKVNLELKKIDPTLTYYQCRHSFCSMMVASGVPINSIASLMGRSVNGISAYVQRITENSTLAKATAALRRTEILETPPEDLFE